MLEIKRGTPVVEGPKSHNKQDVERVHLSDMYGKACRDCINDYQELRLVREDCKFEYTEDGHRKMGTCAYCERTVPLVIGLKMSGVVKTIGHK